MATDLYERTIAFDYGDQRRCDLMRRVWEPTPWMVDAYTGSCGEQRERLMLHWLHESFGPMCSPIHERGGRWQRGSATVHGWTWFGFSTRFDMITFVDNWPRPEHVGQPPDVLPYLAKTGEH